MIMPELSPTARERLLAEVMQAAVFQYKVKHHNSNRYTPYGSAVEIINSTEPEVIASGPAGTGKSLAWLHKINNSCWQYPGARWAIIRQTRESITESILPLFEDYVLGEGHPIIGNVRRENRHSYRYPNGSVIVLGGMNKPTRVLSSEYDGIYVPEVKELVEGSWEHLRTRVSGRRGRIPHSQLGGDTNPDAPEHWILQRSNRGTTRLIYCTHQDNPTLFNQATGEWTPKGVEYMRGLSELTGVRKEWYYYGRWVAAEGVVYEDWNPAVHIIDRFDIPAEWRRFRVVDFGYINPFVCGWWAVSPDGDLIRYREIYHTGMLVQDHAEDIKRLSEGEHIETTVCDHDAEDIATLERCGIPTTKAIKEVSPGIQAVAARLRHNAETGTKPRLKYMRDSLVQRDPTLVARKKPTCTEEEFASYVWPTGSDGKPLKEHPVKVNDHGLDMSRYAVVYVDGYPTFMFETVIDDTPDKTADQLRLEKWINENAS